MPAKSKAQQRFMGMVHAAQKGEKPASNAVAKVAKSMKKSDAEDYASTKHKGLPEKKKKEEQKIREMIKTILVDEGFAGGLKKEQRKKFDKNRRKQSEVLGYKLTGIDDLKTDIGDATVKESGILYRAGVKKYGKEGMRKIQSAAGKRKSHEEIGKIKDKYEKNKKEGKISEIKKLVFRSKTMKLTKTKLKQIIREEMLNEATVLVVDKTILSNGDVGVTIKHKGQIGNLVELTKSEAKVLAKQLLKWSR